MITLSLSLSPSGCDGDRLYFDGCCLVSLNDSFIAQGSQFTLSDIEVTVATVDLDDVVSYRGSIGSRGPQASQASSYPHCHLPISICNSDRAISRPIGLQYFMPEEEIMLGQLVWLFVEIF